MLIRLGEPREGAPEPATPTEQYEHWHALGVVRIRRGDGKGAVAALRRASALTVPGTPQAAEVEDAARQADELVRLRAVILGEAQAHDNNERIFFTQLCEQYGWLAGAAKLYAQALETDPSLAHSQGSSHYVTAARYAARAGTGATQDDPPPSAAAKARLRGQALAWLRAERDNSTRRLGPAKPETRRRAAENFQSWKNDPDLAGVRDSKALEALPKEEREAWQAFWREVESSLPGPPG